MSSSPEWSTTETSHHNPRKRASRTKQVEIRAENMSDGGKERQIKSSTLRRQAVIAAVDVLYLNPRFGKRQRNYLDCRELCSCVWPHPALFRNCRLVNLHQVDAKDVFQIDMRSSCEMASG